LILISLGVGVAIFNNDKAGFIVLFVGAAYLVASLLEKKSKNDQQPPNQ
jgi:biotin transporter BioY